MNPSQMSSQTPTVHKGLEGIVAGETSISDVDGQRCQLVYRGYSIDELVGRVTYEETSFLLLHGTLPSRPQLTDWTRPLEAARTLEPPFLSFLQALPTSADPMALLRTAASWLGLQDPEADDPSVDAMRRKSIRAIAALPAIVAVLIRLRAGQPFIAPKAGLSHAESFLAMLHGMPPTDEQARALDAYFVLLADHGFNASTFTARTVTATQSDYHSAIVAAIGALKGPLHGAANRKAMEMLVEIGSPERVEAYVQRTLADHKRFMGFGHRVYKGEDPRAKHLKDIALRLAQASSEPQWLAISERLQEAVRKAKGLSINVDFYSASLLHYLGVPTAFFTTMFACARIAGWSAHVIEQAADSRLIRPLALYVGPRDLRVTPLDQRPSSASP